METIRIPFTEEIYNMVLREAKRRGVQPEVLLKIWILERAKSEADVRFGDERSEEGNVNALDLLSLPLRFGYMVMTSATATISTLANEISTIDGQN